MHRSSPISYGLMLQPAANCLSQHTCMASWSMMLMSESSRSASALQEMMRLSYCANFVPSKLDATTEAHIEVQVSPSAGVTSLSEKAPLSLGLQQPPRRGEMPLQPGRGLPARRLLQNPAAGVNSLC